METGRRSWLARAAGFAIAFGMAAAGGFPTNAEAQQPVKIGIGIAQTGSLGAGGKAALLGHSGRPALRKRHPSYALSQPPKFELLSELAARL